jgi:hypothetical protein
LLEGFIGLVAEILFEFFFDVIEEGLFCGVFSSRAISRAHDEISLSAAMKFAAARSEEYR